MKKLIILALVILLSTAGFGAVLYEEHFDYADEAALDAVWTNFWADKDFSLNTTLSSDGDGKSALGTNGGWFLGQNANIDIGGVGVFDITISVDWYVDTLKC